MECPRCGKPMNPTPIRNALSRVEDTYICSACGNEEAMMDFQCKPPLPREFWHDKNRYIAEFHRMDRSRLMSQEQMLAFLKNKGGDYSAISQLIDYYHEELGIDPVWRFPLPGDSYLGGFVVPVSEGTFWIPYDLVDTEDCELLNLEKVCLLNAEDCECFESDLRTYSDGFCQVMRLLQYEMASDSTPEKEM